MTDFERELLTLVKNISTRLDNIEKFIENAIREVHIEEEATKLADYWIYKDDIYRRAAIKYNEKVDRR